MPLGISCRHSIALRAISGYRSKLVQGAVVVGLLLSPSIARADVVLDWNAIAVNTAIANGQNPFAQARFAAITQLAVFEAVNAVTGEYKPYLGTIFAAEGTSAEAAAVAAAHAVLRNYFPASALTLDAARDTSLAALPDAGKSAGVALGQAAAAAMILLRGNDGSSPAAFQAPGPVESGVWQTTPSCPPAGGINYQWKDVTPFGLPSAGDFLGDPPPFLTSRRYARDYLEVKTVGSFGSPDRPLDRSNVARFYAASSPTLILNMAARQIATAQGRSLSENAQALALLNMSINDSLVVSFYTKYHYNFWRPETAIRAGDTDSNPRTEAGAFVPFITTPCFPSYPSNHASGTNGGTDMLTYLYGGDGHALTVSNPAVPGIVLQYTSFSQIADDVDDARIYGGIHFRFDQEGGHRIGSKVATYIFRMYLNQID